MAENTRSDLVELKPVKQYQEPKLPTRRIIDECPQLLEIVPRRWQTNPVVLSALAGVCALILGSRVMADNEPASVSRVAPVFNHGEGRSSFGCMAINPPVFLSEDEARKTIEEEAKRAGITFVSSTSVLQDVLIPTLTYENDGRMVWSRKPLVLDGQDSDHQVFYEYISWDDMNDWEEQLSTVYSYDSRAAARRTRELLKAARPAGAYAVFYDPFFRVEAVRKDNGAWDHAATMEKRQIEGMESERELLRKQVQDFIAWLKTQGVI